MIDIYQYESWLEAQISKATNKKRKYPKKFVGERSYLHFDPKLYFPRPNQDVSQEALLKELILDEKKLLSHGFLPFIKDDRRTRKFVPKASIELLTKDATNQKLFPYIKSRPTMYASHKDATIFSIYSFALNAYYEAELIKRGLELSALAYRSINGMNNIDFAKIAFDYMENLSSFDCIMVDVKGFFDNLNHDLLKERWDSIIPGGFKNNSDHLKIYNEITHYRYIHRFEVIRLLKLSKRPYNVVEKGCKKLCKMQDFNSVIKHKVKKNNNSFGIPQGSPISGVLANIYLLEFDSKMKSYVVDDLGGLYQRYSDDLIIVIPHSLSKDVYEYLNNILADELLKLGVKKTEIFQRDPGNTHLINITDKIEHGGNSKRTNPQYLGFHYDGISMTLRPSTVGKHFRKPKNVSYLSQSRKKIATKKITRQVNNIRKKAKVRIAIKNDKP